MQCRGKKCGVGISEQDEETAYNKIMGLFGAVGGGEPAERRRRIRHNSGIVGFGDMDGGSKF